MRPRGSTRVRDENMPVVNIAAGQGKTLHSRAKSTSILSTLIKNGVSGIQAKPQRRAFQDLTNSTRPAQDDFGFKYDALSLKQTLAPLKEVTNATQAPSTTLLAPAQRNLTRVSQKAAPAAPVSTVTSAVPKHVVTEPACDLSHPRKVTQKAITKKSTQIFRESSSVEGVDSAPALLQSRNIAPVHQILEAPREKTSIVAPVESEQLTEPRSFSADILESVNQVLTAAHSIHAYDKQLPPVPSLEVVEKVQSRSSESDMYLPALEELPPLPLDTAHDDLQAPLSAIEAQEQAEEDDEHYYDAEPTARSFRSIGDNTTGGLTQVVEPRVTARVLKELEEANEFVKETRTEEDIEDEAWDTSMVAEYGDEIFAYMRALEVSFRPSIRTRPSLTPHRTRCDQTSTTWTTRQRSNGRCALFLWTGSFRSTLASNCFQRHYSLLSTTLIDSFPARLSLLESCSSLAPLPSSSPPSTRRSTAHQFKRSSTWSMEATPLMRSSRQSASCSACFNSSSDGQDQ
jgi:G2/mitotic-specific cyclin 3/4